LREIYRYGKSLKIAWIDLIMPTLL
jgi:hypothetical protein